jgi:hypothetical protein
MDIKMKFTIQAKAHHHLCLPISNVLPISEKSYIGGIRFESCNPKLGYRAIPDTASKVLIVHQSCQHRSLSTSIRSDQEGRE